jgi:hypothetical protein
LMFPNVIIIIKYLYNLQASSVLPGRLVLNVINDSHDSQNPHTAHSRHVIWWRRALLVCCYAEDSSQ